MNYAPIVIFAFNRPEALKNTVISLLANEEAKASNLYIFVDGARLDKIGEAEKVKVVQEYVKSIKGFRSIEYFFSDKNKGLSSSIINGVNQIISKYGRAIIIEDDLTFSTNFLSFMNQGLEKYEKERKIFSICGYTNKINVPKDYTADSYFCTRSSSWGWATWVDRWNSIDWVLNDWKTVQSKSSAFNKWGGSDCWKMLNDWHKGKNQSWAIRFCFNQFLQNKLSLFPVISKVNNNGFDGKGTNCKNWSRFKFEFDTTDNKNFQYPSLLRIVPSLYKSAMAYNGIFIRIWSKIMYIVH
jgi:hypothetical protein